MKQYSLALWLLHFLLLQVYITAAWDDIFRFEDCYEKRMDERMPLSMDNLIAILEGYERDNPNTSPEDVADALLFRYRTNGIKFNPNTKVLWTIDQGYESDKQDLDDKLLKTVFLVPEDTFSPREECSLHMMLSHSIDTYPHAGVDYVWENSDDYRGKRSLRKSSDYSSSRYNRQKSSYSSSNVNNYVVGDTEMADHPVEFGVVQTTAGPVAAGLLLAGIKSWDDTRTYSVADLVGTDNAKEYMPTEMMSKKVEPLLGTTISGEIAEAAIVMVVENEDDFEIGPIGLFGNCSSCGRIFSLEDNDVPYISRAEVFGAIDGVIIAKTLNQMSSSQSLKLSEILRMYYGDHGLFNAEIKACNRKNIFNRFQDSFKEQIEEQALNYAYAFQDNYADLKRLILLKSDEEGFDYIENAFMDYIDPVVSVFMNFMSSYSYDDPGYNQCNKLLSSDDVATETQVDLVVVYSPTGSTEDIEKQVQYIALTARKIGVGYHRSRIAVLNGMTEKWLAPMTNFSNIADYACNYTTFMNYAGGSSQDFIEILEKLTVLYEAYYSFIRADSDRTGHNSQVVLWNLPNSFDGNEDEMERAWDTFNWTFPDITFIFAGAKDSQLNFFSDEEKKDLLYVATASNDAEEISDTLAKEIKKAPRMFVYPACDTKVDEYDSYNEDNHVYTLYVSPNFTTYVRIPPYNFRFSEKLTLKFQDSDTRVCISRVNREPSDDDDTDDTFCESPPFDYKEKYLCDRYVEYCSPLYISIRGDSSSNPSCTDDLCLYPNQEEVEFTHDGMVCGGSSTLPHLALLALSLTFFYFLRQ